MPRWHKFLTRQARLKRRSATPKRRPFHPARLEPCEPRRLLSATTVTFDGLSAGALVEQTDHYVHASGLRLRDSGPNATGLTIETRGSDALVRPRGWNTGLLVDADGSAFDLASFDYLRRYTDNADFTVTGTHADGSTSSDAGSLSAANTEGTVTLGWTNLTSVHIDFGPDHASWALFDDFVVDLGGNTGNGNLAPTGIALSAATIDENAPVNTLVGTLTALDPDAGDTHTFTVVGGAPNAFTLVNGNELRTAASFDYETQPSQAVTVRATDAAGAFIDQNFTVQVNDVDESTPPPPGGGTPITVGFDGLPSGSLVSGTSWYTDPSGLRLRDAGVNGLHIEHRSGNPFVRPAGWQTGLRVDADGSAFDLASFDYLRRYTDDADFTVTGTHVDGSTSTQSVSINAGNPSGTLGLNWTNLSSVEIDFGPQNASWALFDSFNVIIGGSGSAPNTAPTDITLSNTTFAEDAPAGHLVGTLTATDADAGDTHAFALVGGDTGSFVIVNGNELRTVGAFDYETQSVYAVTVRANDGAGAAFEKSLSLAVTDVPEAIPAPTITSITQDTGSSHSDFLTSDARLVVAGTGEPGATVQLASDSAGALGSAVVDAGGFWAIDASGVSLPEGPTALTANQTDPSGNVSVGTATQALVIDTQAPAVVLISPSNGDTVDTPPIVTGNVSDVHAISLLEAQIDGGAFAPVALDASGTFSVSTGLASDGSADGTHSVSVRATDRAGNVSSLTTASFVLASQAVPDVPPAITQVNFDTGLVDIELVAGSHLSIGGTATPGDLVTLNEQVLGTVGTAVVDAEGQWQFDATSLALTQAVYRLTAEAASNGGTPSASNALEVVILGGPSGVLPSITPDRNPANILDEGVQVSFFLRTNDIPITAYTVDSGDTPGRSYTLPGLQAAGSLDRIYHRFNTVERGVSEFPFFVNVETSYGTLALPPVHVRVTDVPPVDRVSVPDNFVVGQAIRLTNLWDSPFDALTYVIDWGDGSSTGPFTNPDSAGRSTINQFHTYQADGDFTIVVTATDDSGNYTSTHTITSLRPDRVSEIQVLETIDGPVSLAWDAADRAEGYRVERRSLHGEVWQQLDLLGSGETSYTDSNGAAETRYLYRVTAVNAFYEATPSNETPGKFITAGGDEDLDGLSNAYEAANGLNARGRDTDGDGLLDGWEVQYGASFDPLVANAADLDTDGDGLTALQESNAFTNPFAVDSDGDGVADNEELLNGTDPLDPQFSAIAGSTYQEFEVFVDSPRAFGGHFNTQRARQQSSLHGSPWSFALTVDSRSRLGTDLVDPDSIRLRRGESYSVSLERYGLNWPDAAYADILPYQDAPYLATIREKFTNESRAFFSENAQGLIGAVDAQTFAGRVEADGGPNPQFANANNRYDTFAAGRSVELHVPEVTVRYAASAPRPAGSSDFDLGETRGVLIGLSANIAEAQSDTLWIDLPGPAGDYEIRTADGVLLDPTIRHDAAALGLTPGGDEVPLYITARTATGYRLLQFTTSFQNQSGADPAEGTIHVHGYLNASVSDQPHLVPEVDLTAHRTGEYYGVAVSAEVEASGDAARYLILTNDDREEASDGALDYEDLSAAVGTDDDLAYIQIAALDRTHIGSSLVIELLDNAVDSNPGSSAVRLFDSSGSLFYDASATGDSVLTRLLAADDPIFEDNFELYAEGLYPVEDLVIKVVVRNDSSGEESSDVIHLSIADWDFINSGGDVVHETQPIWQRALLDAARSGQALAGTVEGSYFKSSIVNPNASAVLDVVVYSEYDTTEFYNDTLLMSSSSSSAMMSEHFGVLYSGADVYRSGADGTLSFDERIEVSNAFGVNLVHNEGARAVLNSQVNGQSFDRHTRRVGRIGFVELSLGGDEPHRPDLGDSIIVSAFSHTATPSWKWLIEAEGGQVVQTFSDTGAAVNWSVKFDTPGFHTVTVRGGGLVPGGAPGQYAFNHSQKMLVWVQSPAAPANDYQKQAWDLLRLPGSAYVPADRLTLNRRITELYATFFNQNRQAFRSGPTHVLKPRQTRPLANSRSSNPRPCV